MHDKDYSQMEKHLSTVLIYNPIDVDKWVCNLRFYFEGIWERYFFVYIYRFYFKILPLHKLVILKIKAEIIKI